MARTLGFEPRPAVLETDMLPITPSPYNIIGRVVPIPHLILTTPAPQ